MENGALRGCGRICFIVFMAITMLASCVPGAQAWSNGGYSADPLNPDYGTHDWIAERALAIQTKDVSFLSTTYHAKYLLGTEAPDNPAYIGDSTSHHVYYYLGGTLQEGDGAVRAAEEYDLALAYLNASDRQNAAYHIGAMAHYISDLAVFGHTMGSGTDWGAEVHHSDYENTVESMIGSLPSPTGLALGDKYASNAALALAKDTTFGSGAIKANIWMDANYNWANSIFKSSAKASLNASIVAVASAINHMMIATTPPAPPPEPVNPTIPPPEVPATPTPVPKVPEPPASLTALINGTAVTLAWTSPSSNGGSAITEYLIYRGTDPDNLSYVNKVPSNLFSWKDNSMERGETYYYQVVARNSVGMSNASEAASATIPDDIVATALAIVLSSISIATASGGALLWRRRRKSR